MAIIRKIIVDGTEYNIVDNQTIVSLLTNSNVIEVDTTSNWDTDNIYIYRGTTSGSFTNNHVYVYDIDQWVDIGAYSREGFHALASGIYSHAEGNQTSAPGENSHAEGYNTEASGNDSHTEGYYTRAQGEDSHSEGNHTQASGGASHAEGYYAFTQGMGSHAEGNYTRAVGNFSHAEGTEAYALGHSSHAGGFYTKATRKAQTVIGRYNEEDTQGTDGTEYGKYAFIIGNGSDSSHRSNALAVNWNGDVECETINGTNIDNLASVDGSYDDMTIGSAKQLLSDTYVENKVPYIKRASQAIGDREQDTLVGMDLVWNQLADKSKYPSGTDTVNGVTITNNGDGSFTLNGTSTATVIYDIETPLSTKMVSGHKYLFFISDESKKVALFNSYGRTDITTLTAKIVTYNSGTVYLSLYIYGIATVNNVRVTPQVIDLTAMFGPTIADYINTLETGTAGAGVAWVRRYLTKDYYPYSAPTMQNGVASSHETTGFNQWDEETRNGYYDVTTGAYTANSSYICNANMIDVLPNTTYCITAPSGINHPVFFYDYDGNFISCSGTNFAGVQTFTTPSNCYKLAFFMDSPYGTTYKNDICINFHYDGERDGEYEPYVKHSYPLDDTVDLHGIPKIDASGNLYADGDTYEADGTVTRRYGIVDLGTLTWSYDSTYNLWNSDSLASLVSRDFEQAEIAPFVCENYTVRSFNGANASILDGNITEGIAANPTYGNIIVKNGSSTTQPSGNLVYPLATPTTESAEPFQTPQICSPYGTEEYVTEGLVPVGHITKYYEDLRGKIEDLPSLPTSNGEYKLKIENGVATWVSV